MITHAAPLPPDFYEKTIRNIANLRQEYKHNDTLHRFLGDAEAAIANLIVLEAEARTDRDSAQAQCRMTQGESDLLRVQATRRAQDLCGEIHNAHTERDRWSDQAATFQRERDTARGAVQALEATVRRLEAENQRVRNHLTGTLAEISTAARALNDGVSAPLKPLADRIVRERDEARAERDRALAAALEARNAASDWRTRFDALTTRAADLVKERDHLRTVVERLERDEARAAPSKVGDRVVEEVWRAIEVEQSRVDRRLADLHELRSKAFEAALKRGDDLRL